VNRLLHGLILAVSLGYFLISDGENLLLSLLFAVALLNSLLTLFVLIWIKPGSGQETLHQTLLREEEEWWQARLAARRGQP
jgi:hypothetical protein